MQEDLEQRTVSVSIQAAKLSGRVLRAAIAAVLQKMEQERTMPRVGRNSMKRLTYKDPGATTPAPPIGMERLTTGMMPVVRCSVFLRRRRLIRGGTETM